MRCLNVRLMGLLACTAAANATNTKAANAGRGEGTIVQHGSTPQASTPCVKATMRILYGGDGLRHNKGPQGTTSQARCRGMCMSRDEVFVTPSSTIQ